MAQVRLITDLSRYRDKLDRAMSHDIDGNSALGIVERVKNGEYLAVELDGSAVLIAEILEGTRRTLNVVVCAGKGMDGWLDTAIRHLRDLAIDQNCNSIRVQGRKGWLRKLKAYGFCPRAVIMEGSV